MSIDGAISLLIFDPSVLFKNPILFVCEFFVCQNFMRSKTHVLSFEYKVRLNLRMQIIFIDLEIGTNWTI